MSNASDSSTRSLNAFGGNAVSINLPNLNNSLVNGSYRHLCRDWPHCATREIDTAGWLFDEKEEPTTNLTVIPALAVIIFLILVFFKMHKWYKDGVRRKARGDVEFDDDSEVNYGIIREGDKEFCKVEIRSDTTSVYDTVNSFRFFGNGHTTCVGATSGCHETVTSYKSLLIQRGDPSHYDSVKSYKAFLKQVTGNKNFDVEVKLLENYPKKCKSVEHCYIMEEDHGPAQISKLKLLPSASTVQGGTAEGKKKNRHRRASGDPLGPMRKRSASNPTYSSSRSTATSLPSIHYSVSSDSSNEEDTRSAFRMNRKKAFEDRCKKMTRSCSGGKLSKVSKNMVEEQEANPKRKRHYSADGGHSNISKPLLGFGNVPFRASRPFQHELNNLRESISETDPKPEEHVLDPAQEESSSENPDSSPSSRNSSFSSDAIQSASDDDETKLVTQISAISDCTTFNSNNELASSLEQLSTHSIGSNGLVCMDSVQSVIETSSPSSHGYSIKNEGETDSVSPSKSSTNDSKDSDNSSQNPKIVITNECKDSWNSMNNELKSSAKDVPSTAVKSDNLSSSHVSSVSHLMSTSSPIIRLKHKKPSVSIEVEESAEDTDNSVASNPRRVKRFHVTSVQQKDDLTTLKSDSFRNSSGGSGSGSLFES